MPIPTFDASSSGNNAAATSSLTVSHVVTGLYPALVAFVKVLNGQSITSVTYNGVSMTAGTTSPQTSQYDVVPYYLLTPATGTHNIVITLPGTTTIEMVAMSYTGVDSAGIDTSYIAQATVATSLTPSASTAVVNEIIVQGMSYSSASGANPTLTPASSGTNRITDTLSNNNGLYGFELDAATVTSYTIGGTLNGGVSANLCLSGVSLKPHIITTFNKSASASVTNAASRLATVARMMTYKKSLSATVSNAASRLATVVKRKIWSAVLSVTVSNAASRLVSLYTFLAYRFTGKSTDTANTFGGKSTDTTNTFSNKSTDSTNHYQNKS